MTVATPANLEQRLREKASIWNGANVISEVDRKMILQAADALAAKDAEIAKLRAQVKEPLTNEGWMLACLEAREERNRFREELAAAGRVGEKENA